MNVYRGKSVKQFYLASLLYDSIDDNNFSAVKFVLCQKQADPNIILPTSGISSFHLAIGCDDEDFAVRVTRLILQNGGNPNVCSDDGLTPVHIAAAWGRIEILEMLLRFGGDPESRDSNWMTPIHYATEEDFRDCIDLLKSYSPSKYEVLYNVEKEDCFQYNLDKVFVNNGYTTGEYKVCSAFDSINVHNSIEKLPNLPRPDTNKYVLSWFDTHIDDRGGKTFIKDQSIPNNVSDEDKPLPYESSFDESENENSKKRNFTFRKAYKKKIKIKQPHSIPIEDIGVEKNEVISSGFDSAESEHKCEAKRVSSESGIVSLPNSKESPSKITAIKLDPRNFESINSKSNYCDNKIWVADNITNNLNTAVCNYSDKQISTKNTAFVSNIAENTSDYLTCSSNSLLNKNIYAITCITDNSTDDDKVANCDSVLGETGITENSFVTVSEVYKYEDKEQGIVLYEKRVHKVSSEANGSVKTLSSKMSSLPDTMNYDVNTLRRELVSLGYSPPGPITHTTKRVYLWKLQQLKKLSPRKLDQRITNNLNRDTMNCDVNTLRREFVSLGYSPPGPITHTTKRVYLWKLQQLKKRSPRKRDQRIENNLNREYSPQLQQTLKDPTWTANLTPYRELEDVVVNDFTHTPVTRKWREGSKKTSFVYLLLDPRKTDNLPCRVDLMNSKDVWEAFLSAIFYVGKGQKTRPYIHLYDAVTHWNQVNPAVPLNQNNQKLQTILDIWMSGSGVVCVELFHNIIPVEAYTREAAIIAAIGMENLSNLSKGNFYGTAYTWKRKDRCMFGTFMLHRAMNIFLHEGERQLFPHDIKST